MRNAKSQKKRPDLHSKECHFCEKETVYIDWKDYPTLKPHVDYFGSMRKRFLTGVCLQHQKMLRQSIERARFMGMLAYRK